MGKKSRPIDKSAFCTCDKCGHGAVSILESQHRRCGGGSGAKPLPKSGAKLPSNQRGTWRA